MVSPTLSLRTQLLITFVWSIGVAVIALTATVFAIELLQAWLPQQSASVTDPLLALGVGLAFRSLYQRMRPRAFARETIFQRARNR